MAYRDTADVSERVTDFERLEKHKIDRDIQEKCAAELQQCGVAMEPTLVNNLTEEINGLRRRLEKLEKLRQALMDNQEVRNLHGFINIF